VVGFVVQRLRIGPPPRHRQRTLGICPLEVSRGEPPTEIAVQASELGATSVHPLVETGRPPEMASLEEPAPVAEQRRLVLSCVDRRAEVERVYGHCRRDPDPVCIGGEPPIAELAAQLVEHLAERAARASGVALRPEDRHQLVTRRAAFQGEVEEQGTAYRLGGKIENLLAVPLDAQPSEGGEMDLRHNAGSGCITFRQTHRGRGYPAALPQAKRVAGGLGGGPGSNMQRVGSHAPDRRERRV
jgi:hypothetical protein